VDVCVLNVPAGTRMTTTLNSGQGSALPRRKCASQVILSCPITHTGKHWENFRAPLSTAAKEYASKVVVARGDVMDRLQPVHQGMKTDQLFSWLEKELPPAEDQFKDEEFQVAFRAAFPYLFGKVDSIHDSREFT
jgi:hypothetical protein